MGFGSRNQVIAEARLEALAIAGKDLRIDEVAEVVADQRHDAVVSGDGRAPQRLVAVVPFRAFAAQQHALPDRARDRCRAPPGCASWRSSPGMDRWRWAAARAVAVGDVENRVAERARPGDELARAGHGFRLAGAHPFAPALRVVRRRDRAAAAPGTPCCRARSRRDRAPRPWAGVPAPLRRNALLLERRAARRGRGDAARRRAGRPVRRWRGIPAPLHPQRGVQTFAPAQSWAAASARATARRQ